MFSAFFPHYEIAPLGSHSLDWEWRKSLDVGTEIDVCDTSNVWYNSTILSKRTRKQNDRKITEIYIGYRFCFKFYKFFISNIFNFLEFLGKMLIKLRQNQENITLVGHANMMNGSMFTVQEFKSWEG